MAFVIRSMSTTDWRPGETVVPYHIFLLPAHKRAGAWWTRAASQAQTWATAEEAQAELDVLFAGKSKPEVAAIDADQKGLPTFWDNQKTRQA